MTPSAPTTLDRAHDTLRRVVARLDPADLARPTPCTRWTVAQVLEHAVLDQGIWASVIVGAPAPAGDAFAPSGDLPADVVALVETALGSSAAVWHGLDAGVATVASPLPQGDLAVGTARAAAALDAAVHAWDIGVAVGLGDVLADGLATDLLPTARELVEPLRAWGAYAPAIPLPGPGTERDGDVGAATLLRYLGRDPHWSVSR